MLFLVKCTDGVVCVNCRDGAIVSFDDVGADMRPPSKPELMNLSNDQLIAMVRRSYTKITNARSGGKESLVNYLLEIWDTMMGRLAEKNRPQLAADAGKEKLVFISNDFGVSPLMATYGKVFMLEELRVMRNIRLTADMLLSLGVEELKGAMTERGIVPKGRNKTALAEQFLENYPQPQAAAFVAEEIEESDGSGSESSLEEDLDDTPPASLGVAPPASSGDAPVPLPAHDDDDAWKGVFFNAMMQGFSEDQEKNDKPIQFNGPKRNPRF